MATKPISKEVSSIDLEVETFSETVSMTDEKKTVNLNDRRSDAKTRNQDLHIKIMSDEMLIDDFVSDDRGEIPHLRTQLPLYPIGARDLLEVYT